MSKYKMVPVEPTAEMIDAAREHHEGEAYLPVSVYKTMVAAAPAVQGEPVAWRNLKEEKPADGQDCITKMKYGIIQGTYSSENGTFSGYYCLDLEWYATHWMPLPTPPEGVEP